MKVNENRLGDRSEGPTSAGTSAPTPAITLPKGGGAIRGIGEKFGTNPVTGTGSISVPIFTSPGRSGFGPQLSLSYDSGAGNGPFGLGWNLSLPSITRKTDKGLPRYRDGTESDVFVLSGAEDLVPVLEKEQQSGVWARKNVPPRTKGGQLYDIALYRPRIEGLFARIERWTNRSDTADVFWRSISKDNIATFYGTDSHSRITAPHDRAKIFSWLICESYDDTGNAIRYEYVDENSAGVPTDQPQERNRKETRSANRYLKRILYGNRKRMDRTTAPPDDPEWMFEAVFDYGEGLTAPVSAEPGEHARVQLIDPEPPLDAWQIRQDAFSTFRSGFEVRTYRLCRRVLMLHHFQQELGVARYLVRSTDFTYRETPIASFITGVVQTGYRLDGETYIKRSMPALEFSYSQATIDDTVHDVPLDSLEHLPAGLEASQCELVDLDAEGSPGILTRQAGGWFHKRNLSPSTFESKQSGQVAAAARFAPVEVVAYQPSGDAGSENRQQFLDLAGDGQVDLVDFAGAVPGFYERTDEENWQPFAPFASLPHLDWNDPNLRFVDLTGDGHSDILISENDAFAWYASLGELGFSASERVSKVLDEEEGPLLVFGDGTQSIYLADMSGDGLTDLVRIRNGEVSYWPNVGHGRFGAKVTMHNAPWFDTTDLFDQRRIRLADIDGSGVTDIIYLGSDGVDLYFNYSGNSWSARQTLNAFPATDDLSSVQAADLLGTGTACLVWSSPLPGHARRSMRYIDLMGGQKPHLLVKTMNNLGAEKHIQYAPSTKFYLLDKRAGTPWITRLPFPVHVVERVETIDGISRNRFVTSYTYRHGYFDGHEREFRGFGFVEQRDTEVFDTLAGSDASSASNIDLASHVPPVVTRTWFHTGVYLGRDRVSRFFSGLGDDTGEYYREPDLNDEEAARRLLDDTILPPESIGDEEREACRALKGSMLRQEVYAMDGTGTQDYPDGHPYTVTEQNFTIRMIQPRDENEHAVFFVHLREAINYHYERHPTDPRVGHAFTLEVDPFGSVLRSLTVGYGRRDADPDLNVADQQSQAATLVTYTKNDVTNPIDNHLEHPDDYRAPLPSASCTYELTGFKLATDANRFSFEEWSENNFASLESATEIAYEATADQTKEQKRLIENVRTRYRRNDLANLLLVGELESLALPGEGYKLAFTPKLLTDVFRRTVNDPPLENLMLDAVAVLGGTSGDRGGYVDMDADGHWWVPSGLVFYDVAANIADPESTAVEELAGAREHFFLPRKLADPFGQAATVEYDAHDLLVVSTLDAVGNSITAQHDYRMLQLKQVTDPNGNRSEVAFDASGLVAGTAVMGKDGDDVGDTLAGFHPELTAAQIDAFYDAGDPLTVAADLLAGATTRVVYDFERFARTRQANPTEPSQWLPVYSATLARETHVSDLQDGQVSRIQIGFSYSDGFGREIQKKIQAEPGPLVAGGPDVSPRWVGSGWSIFNNKGKPVRQYEPFFSQLPERRHQFEFGIHVGVSPILFYDPVGRVVATLHPNHTWEKVVFDAWQQSTYDVNDTVLNADGSTDPKSDQDVKGFFSRLPDTDYLPTWYEQRVIMAPTDPERVAADNAAVHRQTPSVVHFDTLGRAFLTIAHNRFLRNDVIVEEKYPTRLELDIEGNQRAVRDPIVQGGDALGRVVMRYEYDMLGNRIHQASMEAGERWTLSDATGKLIRAWDSRRFARRVTYDELRRPTGLFVTENGVARLAERTVYGEGQGSAHNHKTRVFQVFDGAGIVTSEAYDFKGNLLQAKRELLADYKTPVDWQQEPATNDGTFTSSTTFDALNRPIAAVAPDTSLYRPTYNEANLLDKIEVNLRGSATATPFVTDIDYNAKGQRTLIHYANGAETTYEYDDRTFRLIHLKTTRVPAPNGFASQIFTNAAIVQDLHYTYDPAGNITRIADDALLVITHDNQQVSPICDYSYDAIYRLIEATGREHIGQVVLDFAPSNGSFRDFPFTGLSANPSDLQALRNYIEQYEYDAVGNFLRMIHQAANGSWTRAYAYAEASLLESKTKQINRLSSTTIGQTTETYHHDAHGNMTAMPHLPLMQWDFEDQLQATSSQIVNGGTPETTFYVYDASGQRVRKVTERQDGTRKNERIYLGGYEIYREYDGTGTVVTLERETLHVMDDKQRIAFVETKIVENGNPVDAPLHVQRYQLNNHLGSASLEVDENGGFLSYEEHHPYGTTAYQAMDGAAEVSLKRYRYTGKERDDETGLYYHGARCYACWLGRWISADPAELADGPNSYAYVKGLVTRATDPTGGVTDEQLAFGAELTPGEKHRALAEGLEFATAITLGAVVITLTGGESTANAPRTADEPRYKAMTNEEVAINAAAGASAAFYLGRIVGPIVAREVQAAAQTAKGVKAASKTPKAVTPAEAALDAPAVTKGAPESAPAAKPAEPKSSGKAGGATSTPGGVGTPVESAASLPTDAKAFAEAFNASEGKLLNQIASDLQAKLSQAGVKNPRLAIAVSAGVVDDKIKYVVTVSDSKALAVLRQYEKHLPEGMKVGVSEPKFVGGKLDPQSHVEIAGPSQLIDEGAKGVVTGTNIPACKGSCEPLWAGESGRPPGNVWHTNRRKQ